MNLSDSSFLVICVSVFLFVTGTVFGSFITCTAYRIAAGEDWTKGRSHCDNCGHVLGSLDLVPVLSYLFLKGKCRYCGKKIPPDSIIVEILTGILFVLMFLKDCTLDLILLRNLILIVLCIGLSLVDLQKYIIPDGFVVAGIVNWAVFGFFSSDWKAYYLSGITGGLVIAGAVLIISLIMDRMLGKESLGGGDVKLLFMVCLYTGAIQGLFLIFLSCIAGLLFLLVLKKDKIPFGPSICLASYIILLSGNAILDWYLGLF